MIKFLSVADLISITNAVLGFLAIIMLFEGEIRLAFNLILLAVVADGLDGIIARKIGHSQLGEYLESMADMTSLVIAPGFFVYIIYKDIFFEIEYYPVYFIFVLVVFLSLGVVRLASFHLMKKDNCFVGLPASAASLIIVILSYMEFESMYILPIILLMAFLMVSNLNFPKVDKKMALLSAILILFVLIFDKQYNSIALSVFFVSIILYCILGPITIFYKNKKCKKNI